MSISSGYHCGINGYKIVGQLVKDTIDKDITPPPCGVEMYQIVGQLLKHIIDRHIDPLACVHCAYLTIDHTLQEATVSQKNRDEYYNSDSLKISDACIMEGLVFLAFSI